MQIVQWVKMWTNTNPILPMYDVQIRIILEALTLHMKELAIQLNKLISRKRHMSTDAYWTIR